MKKSILLTRPRASSERWATLLAQQGFDSVIEPLLTIAPTRTPRPAGPFQACFITSVNAPEALDVLGAGIHDLFPLPCFCVGAATGAAARAVGFTDVRCGTSDGSALAQMMMTALTDKTSPLLHIAGDVVEGKAQEILTKNGFSVTPWVVYTADAADDLTPIVRMLLKQGEIDAVPVFSPRSARLLVSLIEKNRLTRTCHTITAVALSQAVADMLQTLPWRQLCIAASPSEEDVLACLKSVLIMTETEKTASTIETHAPKKKKRNSFFLAATVIILLAGAGAIGLARTPFFAPLLAPTVLPTPDNAALEKRVALLESRLDALSFAPAATQAETPSPDTAKMIATLQNRVAQIESQDHSDQITLQKLIAASFTFWDLREAAKSGHSFAHQLATLRAAASNDALVTEQSAKLEPYAADGVATPARLREDLASLEPSLATPETEFDNGLWGRLKRLLQPLVSVHPLNNPQLSAIKYALDADDAAGALAAAKVLPPETQKLLAPWQAKLEARVTVDEALRQLTIHVIAPPAQGGTP